MPGLYQVALLCEYVYTQTNLPIGWRIIDTEIGENLSQSEMGYFGQAFLNENDNEIVVIHRGTKLYTLSEKFLTNAQTDRPNVFTMYANFFNDSVLALKEVPPEIECALKLGFRVKKNYPQNYITQAGHSLGGFDANIVGYFCQQKVIAFDCPGCRQQLEIMTRYKLNEQQFNHHYNLLAQKDLINQTDTQVGIIYFRTPLNGDWRPLAYESTIEKVTVTLKNHALQTFLDCIPPNAPDPSKGVADIFVTPEYYREQGRKQIEQDTLPTSSLLCALI